MAYSSDNLPATPTVPLKVGVSACLIGESVRFDGGHTRSTAPIELLASLFQFESFCPEVGIGLGIPRKPIKLVGEVEAPRAISRDPAVGDVTVSLRQYAAENQLRLEDLDGFVLMKNSPSCGVFRVRIHAKEGSPPTRQARGIFANAVMRARPTLPIEEGGRLFDPVLRENFVTRVFVHAHWRSVRVTGITPARLVAFHSRYKYLVMAHDFSVYKRLGRIVANLKKNLDEIAETYFIELMNALSEPSSRGGHANVMSHLQGFVKNQLSPQSRQELAMAIESYRKGEIPLLAPMTLLKHHLGDHEASYALDQIYLQPHPSSAGLRRDL